MFFPQLLSRYKRIEITIKIKANFYKEIAQFTILVAIIGNKISKYFFLTSLSQIPYISTQQTYTGSKFNSRDPACYNLFSFSDTSRFCDCKIFAVERASKQSNQHPRLIEPLINLGGGY